VTDALVLRGVLVFVLVPVLVALVATVFAPRTRLADGSYGVCIECGGDIGFERLRANHSAVRCIDCQTMHEKTHLSPSSTPGSSL